MRLAETRELVAATRSALPGTVALVPTMGALHEGHRSLLRRACTLAEHVVVSIFVNPLQFGPGEDFDRYPRTFDADLAMCEAEGVALVFAPSREVMYPSPPMVRICAGELGERLEGVSRPGHFDGVLTVVAKLFCLLRPDIAVFGSKDAQQLALIRRMVADLELPVRIDAAPIVRDVDGLALSSRNRYLTPMQRQQASAIPAALAAGATVAENGGGAQEIRVAAAGVLEAADGLVVDYAAVVDPDTFADVEGPDTSPSVATPAVLAVAARIGNTRLIDNVAVNIRKR
jgi:pantoate--beta-alanine ligase